MGAGEATVRGEQRRVQRFGERDVTRVVHAHPIVKIKRALDELSARDDLDRQVKQCCEQARRRWPVEDTLVKKTSQGARNLGEGKIGRGSVVAQRGDDLGAGSFEQ